MLYSSIKESVKFWTESVKCRGPQIWNLIPDNVKNGPSLDFLEDEIKNLKGQYIPTKYLFYKNTTITFSPQAHTKSD